MKLSDTRGGGREGGGRQNRKGTRRQCGNSIGIGIALFVSIFLYKVPTLAHKEHIGTILVEPYDRSCSIV